MVFRPFEFFEQSCRLLLLAGASTLFAATAIVVSIKPASAGGDADISDDEISAILETHCVSCHSEEPTHPAYTIPQGGLVLESLDDVRDNADAIMLQTVESDIMPLGNETGMSDDERALLGAWLARETGAG